MNTFDLSLDLNKSRNVNPIRLRQGDLNGTTIRALIFDHGALADLSGTTARWVMRLPGGEEYYRKTATVDATASTVTVEVDETQAASVSGRCRGYFQILDGTTVIASTGDVLVEVLPDALEGASVAESYDSAIQDAIDDLNDAIEAIPDTVEDVLEAHPEWTTTVQDGAVTDAKLYQGKGGILARNQRLMYRLANLLTHRTDEGTLAAISDAAKTPMAGLSVYGLSTQDGTPTPSAPVPIVSVEGDEDGNISLWAQLTSDASVTTTTPIDLDGHELRSLPDGTRDELTVGADGRVTLVQRVGEVTLDGSESWTFNSGVGNGFAAAALPNVMSAAGATNAMSDRFPAVLSQTQGDSFYISGTNALFFRGSQYAPTSSAEAKAWASSNPFTVIYALATPVTIDLGWTDAIPLCGPDLTAQSVPTAPFALTYERDLNVTLARLEAALAALA